MTSCLFVFETCSFDRERLIRFTLLIRKNYRTVPYHNFKHGFVVAHAMFMFLSNLSPEHREKLPEYQVQYSKQPIALRTGN